MTTLMQWARRAAAVKQEGEGVKGGSKEVVVEDGGQ